LSICLSNLPSKPIAIQLSDNTQDLFATSLLPLAMSTRPAVHPWHSSLSAQHLRALLARPRLSPRIRVPHCLSAHRRSPPLTAARCLLATMSCTVVRSPPRTVHLPHHTGCSLALLSARRQCRRYCPSAHHSMAVCSCSVVTCARYPLTTGCLSLLCVHSPHCLSAHHFACPAARHPSSLHCHIACLAACRALFTGCLPLTLLLAHNVCSPYCLFAMLLGLAFSPPVAGSPRAPSQSFHATGYAT
jgi:hypothetical protein